MRMFPIPGDNVYPEGITEGPGTSFFVGSTGDGAIYRGDTVTGTVEPFIPPDGDGRVSICGLDVDDYGRLIACDFRGAQVFAYDLATRALAARRRLPAAPPRQGPSISADMTSMPTGCCSTETCSTVSRTGAPSPVAISAP
jgi:streptogramin lyase